MIGTWKRLGGTVHAVEPVLSETAYHAWISQPEYEEIWRQLAAMSDLEALQLIDNVFVREQIQLRIMALFAVSYVLPILCNMFPLIFPIREIISTFTITGISLSGIWLSRARIRRRLRQQLISDGFLICEPCGYDLRGLTEPRCPECGAPFEKREASNVKREAEGRETEDS